MIAGHVRDATGLPLAGASVDVDGRLVAVTDDNGSFVINAPSSGRLAIRISLPGFRPFESAVDAAAGAALDVVLQIQTVAERVDVRAAPERDVTRGFALDPLQVYRTPGAQADVFRAVQTLPGVGRVDEGSGLFVRGGDVSEVLVALDDAVIAHPYQYETPTAFAVPSIRSRSPDCRSAPAASPHATATCSAACSIFTRWTGPRRPKRTRRSVWPVCLRRLRRRSAHAPVFAAR
jgi:hypothetical protein